MDWPQDMPFPVYYKAWQMREARRVGADRYCKANNIRFDWEFMPTLRQMMLRQTGPRPLGNHMDLLEEAMYETECRTFILSAPLINALRETEPRDIDASLLRTPFDLFYVDFSAVEIPSGNTENVFSQTVRGVVTIGQGTEANHRICTENGIDPENGIVGFFIEHAPGDCDGQDGSEAPWTASMASWRVHNGVYSLDHAISTIGGTIEEADLLRVAWNVWAQSILYINSVNRDEREEYLEERLVPRLKGKKGKARRDLKRRIESSGRVFRLGHYIHIPQSSESEKQSHQGGRVNVRFLVRGHWHTYWTGSNRFGNRRQTLKWLKPYWKGPETADTVHGTYIVKETDDDRRGNSGAQEEDRPDES